MNERSPGRPAGGERVGRERIVVGLREMVRDGRCQSISRKELAAHIGITPALVTYYFPDRTSLISETMEGIFDPWQRKLCILLEQAFDAEHERLTRAIYLLLEFFKKERFADDLYANLIRQQVIRGDVAVRMENDLGLIIQRIVAVPDSTGALLAKVLWGACREAAAIDGDAEALSILLVKLVSASAPEHVASPKRDVSHMRFVAQAPHNAHS